MFVGLATSLMSAHSGPSVSPTAPVPTCSSVSSVFAGAVSSTSTQQPLWACTGVTISLIMSMRPCFTEMLPTSSQSSSLIAAVILSSASLRSRNFSSKSAGSRPCMPSRNLVFCEPIVTPQHIFRSSMSSAAKDACRPLSRAREQAQSCVGLPSSISSGMIRPQSMHSCMRRCSRATCQAPTGSAASRSVCATAAGSGLRRCRKGTCTAKSAATKGLPTSASDISRSCMVREMSCVPSSCATLRMPSAANASTTSSECLTTKLPWPLSGRCASSLKARSSERRSLSQS
mmetsp:Transcript_17135/g.58588  ORF Transcript_17135/g.58588 Transcript_17135/m.58588 type:complete len:288 (+) Transcript_17135:399-1262(+)